MTLKHFFVRRTTFCENTKNRNNLFRVLENIPIGKLKISTFGLQYFIQWGILTYFVRRSITVQLTSCSTGLALTKQVNHSTQAKQLKPNEIWPGALVQWLWEETHVQKVVGLNPIIIYWMDIFFRFICCKIVMFV